MMNWHSTTLTVIHPECTQTFFYSILLGINYYYFFIYLLFFLNKTLLLIKQQKWLSEFCVKIDRVASKN
jgi:hypothetical protein